MRTMTIVKLTGLGVLLLLLMAWFCRQFWIIATCHDLKKLKKWETEK